MVIDSGAGVTHIIPVVDGYRDPARDRLVYETHPYCRE